MTVKFNIHTKNIDKILNELRSNQDPIHSNNIKYQIQVVEAEESVIRAQIHFDPSYQPSDFILKERAESAIRSMLLACAHIDPKIYTLDFNYVD